MSKVESENFMKRHPFEPDPGSVGMGPDQLIEAGLARPEDVTTVGAYTELLGLGHALRVRRKSIKMSLAEASEVSGLTRGLLSEIENAKVMNPTLDTLFKYATPLGATITLGLENEVAYEDIEK